MGFRALTGIRTQFSSVEYTRDGSPISPMTLVHIRAFSLSCMDTNLKNAHAYNRLEYNFTIITPRMSSLRQIEIKY